MAFEVGFILQEGEGCRSLGSPLRGGDTIVILQSRRDALNSLDLSGRIKDMILSLYVDHARQHYEAAKVRALQVMTETELASSLQQLENLIMRKRQICERP